MLKPNIPGDGGLMTKTASLLPNRESYNDANDPPVPALPPIMCVDVAGVNDANYPPVPALPPIMCVGVAGGNGNIRDDSSPLLT